jgi:cold-inducible RNA-binding protein
VVAIGAAFGERGPENPETRVSLFCMVHSDRAGFGVLFSMSKKLFVGGLSWGTTDDGLHQAFERFGEIVEAKVITDRETGRSRGFGFVTFAGDEGAISAVSEMNGAQLDGRTIRVNEAENQVQRRGGGGGGGGGRGGPRGGGHRGGGGGHRGGYDD